MDWECIYYKKLSHNEPFCDRGIDLKNCSGSCNKNKTFAEWREEIKDTPFAGVKLGGYDEKRNID